MRETLRGSSASVSSAYSRGRVKPANKRRSLWKPARARIEPQTINLRRTPADAETPRSLKQSDLFRYSRDIVRALVRDSCRRLRRERPLYI